MIKISYLYTYAVLLPALLLNSCSRLADQSVLCMHNGHKSAPSSAPKKEAIATPCFLTKLQDALRQGDYPKLEKLVASNEAIHSPRDHNGLSMVHYIVLDTRLTKNQKHTLFQTIFKNAQAALPKFFQIGNVIPEKYRCFFFHMLDAQAALMSISIQTLRIVPTDSQTIQQKNCKLVQQGCYGLYQDNGPSQLVTGNISRCVVMTGYNTGNHHGFLMHLGSENVAYLDKTLLGEPGGGQKNNTQIQRIIAAVVGSQSITKTRFTLTGGDFIGLAYWKTYLEAFGAQNVTVYCHQAWVTLHPFQRGAVHFDGTTGTVTHPSGVVGMIGLSEDQPPADIKRELKDQKK